MTHAMIGVGDVVYDLAGQGSKMVVVERAADSVDEYSRREEFDLAGYKSHPNLPVREDDPVFTCVYLPDSPGQEPSGTYDFPAGRLARAPVETANQDIDHVRDTITRELLESIFRAAADWDASDMVDEAAVLAKDAGIDPALVEQARELTEAATFGGDLDV